MCLLQNLQRTHTAMSLRTEDKKMIHIDPKIDMRKTFRQQYAELDATEYQLRELPPEQAAAYLLLINQKRQKLLRLQKVLTGLLVGVVIFWIILIFVIS